MRKKFIVNPLSLIPPSVFILAAFVLPWGTEVDAVAISKAKPSASTEATASVAATTNANTGSDASLMSDNSTALSGIDCVVQPGKIAALGSAVPGVLAEVFVSRADYVAAGTVVAELESDVERASLQLADRLASLRTATRLRQLNADFGNRTLQRNQSLYQKASISKQTLDQVETEALIAQLQVQQERESSEVAGIEVARAKAVLKRRSIRAPFDGAITEQFKTVGEYVADDAVLQIASLDPLHIEVVVPLSQLGKVESGMRGNVSIEVPGFEDTQLNATVRRIDPVADAASATYGVLLELPNPDLTIPSGVRCQLDFVAE